MKRGFTLIEIMIVVAILMVLIGLAIPNILRSRSVANEGVAVANLKILSDACQLYHANRGAFPETLLELAMPISNPPYIDQLLGSGSKQGYGFIYVLNGLGFTVNANPTSILGGRYYYVDETGAVHVREGQAASSSDPTLQ
ncbi:MAG: prepilin-type N-terminal cleavage/methylation domain-containing protein [Candidatus Omnitrophica bacterium]|nr:prepilin-type N-terminal cleavage/methylation domain-containing protein [Candidatus Omnitrophota bacterium]MDO9572761.1 prepilin-type N-terminal cleavage/methylation domain-containing protein [Candidatus Omnitrophota bacterium]